MSTYSLDDLMRADIPHNGTVYVAGPYTKPDPAINTGFAIEQANVLFNNNFIPHIPHLTHFWHFKCNRPYHDWIRLDFIWLEKCDVMIRLPGESRGADFEAQHATKKGIPVFLGRVEEFVSEWDFYGKYIRAKGRAPTARNFVLWRNALLSPSP